MLDKESQEYENAQSELSAQSVQIALSKYSNTESEKKKRMQKLKDAFVKCPNDLKTYLYNICVNFSYSDIYQEYISRLSLNTYNNCDYDQIRSSSYISKKDFLKYYNFQFYDNKFELESDEYYEDTLFEDSDNFSDMEEVGRYVLARCMVNTYNGQTSKMKNLLLSKPQYEVAPSYRKKRGKEWAIQKPHVDGKIERKKNNNKCRGMGVEIGQGERKEEGKSAKNTNSKSYTSQLLNLISQRNSHRSNAQSSSNCSNASSDSGFSGSSEEVLRAHMRREQNCWNKMITRKCFSVVTHVKDPREYSFMPFNFYSFNNYDINRKKIKNSCNNNYFYMLDNLEEAQKDQCVEKYYKYMNKIVDKEYFKISKSGEEKKIKKKKKKKKKK
ncbi:amino acid transporter [Plasmodium brasilianum]|uniref:Amino acid transporter n=1 Tax=Plasmodium brasilianum TaxID=5824 RepID=A0ACB9Y902_PLABR|nr:amino acid transporter [Plasmodium brasilianum]